MDLDPGLALEILIGGAGVGLWLAMYGVALLLTRPADVQPAAPTQEFGGEEPPALVSLLTSRWELTEDAAESTLIDLAARKYLEFRQPGNDPLQTTIHVRDASPPATPPLTPYERRILDRVAGLAVGGVVPLTALTFRDEDSAKSWGKRLNAEIVADARTRGLSQRRFSKSLVSGLSLAGGVPVAAVIAAVAHYKLRTPGGDDWGWVLPVLIFGWALVAGFAAKSRGERDTQRGREVAARWLGLKAYLRNDESFAELPPSAVAVWDRYLSYGDAVGAARVCSAVIDLGMGNRKRVWSSFGGTWHRVKVRYPRLWPRYGQKATGLVVKALVALAVAFLILRYADVAAELAPDAYDRQVNLVLAVLVLAVLAYGGYTLLATVAELVTQETITGEVLWLQVWKSSSAGENSPSVPYLHYLAVDDGRDDRTVAWACPSAVANRTHCGDIVTMTVRRWTRRVVELKVDETGRARALAHAEPLLRDSENTENLVLATLGTATARGSQAVASALRAPEVAPARLMTLDEVGRALGMPVTAKGLSETVVGPVAVESYHAANGGRRVLTASVTSGPAADLAMRMRRRSQAVPGIGDEAYAGENWAVGRRGSHLVVLQLHGPARQANPQNVYWLLSTAVSRLP